MMRRLLLAALAILGTSGVARAVPDNFDQIERGRALATAGDCVACHVRSGLAPGQPTTGSVGYAGGRGIETPFGRINAANLTPDRETGIGTWSADDFFRAMHEGLRPDGAHLYPAFPYNYFTRVTRDDSDAIYAYLQSLEPIQNPVNRDTLPFPFSIRASMIAWNALFFTPGEFRPDPQRSAEWNRGAYLVEGLGHCGACHTGKNALGGNSDPALGGGELQAWYAPSLTTDNRTGIGAWSADEIVEYLRTGRNARSAASGPMAEVVQYSTALLPEADLRAMAAYLKQPPGEPVRITAPAPVAAGDAQMRVGEAIYADGCRACHAAAGTGVERLFPRLAGSQVVQQDGPDTLLRVVLQGVRAAATDTAPTGPAMPAFGWRLDDAQVAAVTTYIRNSWGNAAAPVTADQARRMRERLRNTVE